MSQVSLSVSKRVERWLARIPLHSPETEQPFPSPRWVEEQSLLPRLHGDKAVQRMVESRGQISLGSNFSSSAHRPETLTSHLNFLCLSFLICETEITKL